MNQCHKPALSLWLCLLLVSGAWSNARGEAMLELFQTTWSEVTLKIPELAEAGYDSLWLPNPAKGNSGSYSTGYDVYDPFDLGGTNQQGTVATRYGTQDELIRMVQTAHRFGIRIYFDNVMNHRSSTVPGYPGSGTPTNYYPGLIPGDFHLQTVTGGYQNWASVSEWCNVQNVENQPLLGLCDLANEPGTVNFNFGANLGNTATKPVFVRFPNRPDLYMDTNGPSLGTGWGGTGWRPFDGHGQPVPEDVSVYLCRAVAWTLYMTKCDGFRLDAVKHVPANFFGNESGQSDDASFAGYTGAIQAMYDSVHGYGSNVTGNGYVETDGNRNSLFNLDAPRNDAMVFGEYIPSALPQGADFYDYLNSGMRLLNQPLYNQMNANLSGGSLSGMDSRDYTPPGGNCDANGNFSTAQAVNMPQTQDGGTCCPANQGMEDAYFFMHEGLPGVYSDGFNHNTGGGTPIESFANYLGEFGDNSMPDVMYLHNQLSRGGTSSRWSDQNIVAFERYDYRESTNAQDEAVVLFAMNNDTGYPGDISFDDGVSRTSDGYYGVAANGSTAVSNSRNLGLVVGFPPGSVLAQLSSTVPGGGGGRAFAKLLVHGATNDKNQAIATANNADPATRLIWVGGQTLAPGGGAIELLIPSAGWVMYGYQWPVASRASLKDAITLQQGGADAPRLTVYRQDGPNGDTNYNPIFPFKMRGSVDANGNVVGGQNVSNLTYAIDIPVVTNANFDILVRNDASGSNTLVKLDGGMDLNSQMGLGPLSGQDLRDNKPGYATDVYLGYEQTAFQFRNGPEKFAADIYLSNNIVSLGAETYHYTIGGSYTNIPGGGVGQGITNQTASAVYHDPAAAVTATGTVPATQRFPLTPAAGQSADVWVKVNYDQQVDTCFIYYTTDGSNPEGSFGTGKGTTLAVAGQMISHDNSSATIDWWKGTIPAQANGTEIRYKAALFKSNIQPISDAETSGSKYYGLMQTAITNFNPTTAQVWLHNDLNTNNTTTGLQEGLHIVRAHSLLPRARKSSVYNNFAQTFYYDAQLPGGVIVYPAPGTTLTNGSYTVVVRTDSTTTGLYYNIIDSSTNNDDVVTHLANGNGSSNGAPVFVQAQSVSPDPTIGLQYPNLPQEFRFTYAGVPSNGTAAITIKLTKLTTALYPNRFASFTNIVNTAAPSQVLNISAPATDGEQIVLDPGQTYTITACFTSTLTTNNINDFSIIINGVMQPQRAGDGTPLYVIGGSACGFGMRTLSYTWTPAFSTNTTYNIQVVFNGTVTLSATRTAVVGGFSISSVANGTIVWSSVPGMNYQVWGTTNLNIPLAPISGVIPANGSSTFYFDATANNGTNQFYQVRIVQ